MNWTVKDLPPHLRKQAEAKITVRTHLIEDDDRRGIKKPKAPKKPKLSEGVAMLLQGIAAHGFPKPELEIVFHPLRRWRFDAGWRHMKLAVEVDGAVYAQGRHTRGSGFEGDCEKINQAQLLGWRVLRYSTGQVKKGEYLDDLKKVFQ